jgi:hypothetical protein
VLRVQSILTGEDPGIKLNFEMRNNINKQSKLNMTVSIGHQKLHHNPLSLERGV